LKTLNRGQIYEVIAETIARILQERGDEVPKLAPTVAITELPLDSLDIATLVVRLEMQLHVDPFKEWTLETYPQTLDELAEVYRGAIGERP
jgi:acyl carrier protein